MVGSFAASIIQPRTGSDRRVMETYSAFIVALLTEMYGAPVTIYVLSGWLAPLVPGLVATHTEGSRNTRSLARRQFSSLRATSNMGPRATRVPSAWSPRWSKDPVRDPIEAGLPDESRAAALRTA